MIPYEIGFLVVVFAVLSTLNGLFRESRWLSFVCLSLAIFGVTGLVGISPAYQTFFFFSPTIVLTFLIAILFSGVIQRTILSATAVFLLFGIVYLEVATGDYLNKAQGMLVLFAVSMALPSLIFKTRPQDDERVERLFSAQQLWIRIVFLAWCREHMVNIHHYEFFQDGLVALSGVSAFILLFRVGAARETWHLAVKTFLSLAFMAGGLSFELSEIRFLILWALVLGTGNLMPAQRDGNNADLLRRFGLGAFGGAASWGLIFFLDHAPMDFYWKAIWGAMIFVLGLLALVLPAKQKNQDDKLIWVPTLGFVLQGVFLAAVVFWPHIKVLGGQ